MSFQTRTETVSGLAALHDVDAETGLTDEAKQDITNHLQAGGNIAHNSTWRPVGPISTDKNAQYVMAFLDNFMTLLATGITQQEMKIAAYVLKQMEFGNLVSLSQTAMAVDFKCSRQVISKHFKSLEKKGFFVKKDGHLFVNSTIFIKGLSHKMDADRVSNLKTAHDTKAGKFAPSLRAKPTK